MRADDSVKAMEIIVSFHDSKCPQSEPFAVDHVINELLENDANAVQKRPHKDIVEESVPDVDEKEGGESGQDLQHC